MSVSVAKDSVEVVFGVLEFGEELGGVRQVGESTYGTRDEQSCHAVSSMRCFEVVPGAFEVHALPRSIVGDSE